MIVGRYHVIFFLKSDAIDKDIKHHRQRIGSVFLLTVAATSWFESVIYQAKHLIRFLPG